MLRATSILIAFTAACTEPGALDQAVTQVAARGPGPAAPRAAAHGHGPAVTRTTDSDAAFTVELPAAAFLNDLDDRERREQLRDWAVFATLAHEGATPEQTAAATYQMPPARLPYLDELYSFSYGRGRRAYFGDRVLLFTDADDPDPTATVGRLADQVRMEIGEIPGSAELYVVEDQRNEATLRITPGVKLAGAQLFSGEYGYVEAAVSDADQLAAWLSRVDDLSRVRIEAGKLLLGGRRFPHSRTEGVTLEDVAAIYQAPGRIHDRKAVAEQELDALNEKYRAEYRRRLVETLTGKSTTTGDELSQTAKRIKDEIDAEISRSPDAAAIVERASVSNDAGFSLDPRWLPDSDGRHPLMLERLKRLANDPCAEISRIAGLAPKLLGAEPDESRRSGEAWAASDLADAKIDPNPETCTWLRGFIGQRIAPVTTALEAASPQDWREGFGPFEKLRNDLQALRDGLKPLKSDAVGGVLEILSFYKFDTGAQCARYDGIEGTEVGMTLFYTDVLAKLWAGIDYHHSAPLQSVPGFLTMPRVDVSPAFAEEVSLSTRVWFAPRADGWSRTVTTSASDLAFAPRFSRVYAAGSNPAEPGKETVPGEDSRLMIGWWDRHFDEIADHEQQYHRQNEIMKWSATIAVMLETSRAPTFLSSVEVKRTAKFFPWLSAHRDRLRFKEPLPERPTPYSTECIALLQSYPYTTAGMSYSINGGASLAGHEVVATAPSVNSRLPRGQRMSPPRTATPRPHPVPAGRTVSIKDAVAARVRSNDGPMTLGDVSARFGGTAGAPAVTVGSKAGKLVEVGFAPSERGVRINFGNGPVEHARSVIEDNGGTSISFDGRHERIVAYDGSLIEVTTSDKPRGAPVTVRANDTYPPGWHLAQAADAGDVHRRMDRFPWQIVNQDVLDSELPNIRFTNEPPPDEARAVEVHGLKGITTARVTEDGEVFVARPADRAARDDWYHLHDHVGAFDLPQDALLIDLKESKDKAVELRLADLAARDGRLEDAARIFERRLPKQPTTDGDKVRAALRDVGLHRASTARDELQALLDDSAKLSPESSTLLIHSFRGHGEVDIATLFEHKQHGEPLPAGVSIVARRGEVGLRYKARRLATTEVDTAGAMHDAMPFTAYFESAMVSEGGFEPDFSGPIAHWLNEPRASVHEWKANPNDLDSAAIIEFKPKVIVDESTGREYSRARNAGAPGSSSLDPQSFRIYFIQSSRQCGKSGGNNGKSGGGNSSAQSPGDARGNDDGCTN